MAPLGTLLRSHRSKRFLVLGSTFHEVSGIRRSSYTVTNHNARVVTQQSSRSLLTEFRTQLHWLPVEWQIQLKLASLVYKVYVLVIRHTLPISYNITNPQGPHVHLYSFSSATQPFIWCLRFLRCCAQNMELHTSSHPPVPNILFLQTSS